MKKGFTLIELLVVVLIIGILAAIALPQYQKAVDKARFSQALIWGKNIRDAEQVYKMANGTYTTDLDELGVSLPNCEKVGTPTNEQRATYHCADGWKVDITPNSNIKTGASGYVYLPGEWAAVEFYFFNDTRLCFAISAQNTRGVNLCKSMGGTYFADAYFKLP